LEHEDDGDPSNDDSATHVQLGSEPVHVAITGHGQIALANTLMLEGDHVRLKLLDDSELRWTDDVAELTVELQAQPGDGAPPLFPLHARAVSSCGLDEVFRLLNSGQVGGLSILYNLLTGLAPPPPESGLSELCSQALQRSISSAVFRWLRALNRTHGCGHVRAGERWLRATLVWTDPPASPTTFLAAALVNDLDLEVTLPAPPDGTNATTVLGNSLYRLPSQLLSADGRDRINNVEVSSLNSLRASTLHSQLVSRITTQPHPLHHL